MTMATAADEERQTRCPSQGNAEREAFVLGLASGRLDNERGMWRTCEAALSQGDPADDAYDRGYAMYEPAFAWVPHAS